MGVLNKVADLAQKGSVLGLASVLGYQVYQIGTKATQHYGELKNQHQHADIMKKINEKVEEEAQDKDSIDNIPDRYDPDDSSYLKKVPKLN